MNIIETERLFLREFSLKDIEYFYQLNNDPQVIKFTGDSPFNSKYEVKEFIEGYDHYKKYGFGRWSVYLKSNNQFIGFNGLRKCEFTHEVDIGFRFVRNQWSKGYAYESSLSVLTFAFKQLKLKRIIARAMEENKASHAVIKKLGMDYISTTYENNVKWSKYELLSFS